MEEVIARGKKDTVKYHKVMLVMGVIIIFLLALALILYPVVGWRFTFLNDFEYWELVFFTVFGFVFGGVLVAISVFQIIRTKRLPEKIIVLKDGTLYFADGFNCKIGEIHSVYCELTRTDYGGLANVKDGSGSLTVVVNGGERMYKRIADVKSVNERIVQLMFDCKDKNNNIG